jgi:hypothetical protein
MAVPMLVCGPLAALTGTSRRGASDKRSWGVRPTASAVNDGALGDQAGTPAPDSSCPIEKLQGMEPSVEKLNPRTGRFSDVPASREDPKAPGSC